MLLVPHPGAAEDTGKKPSSYMPVVIDQEFATTFVRMKAAKAEVEKRQAELLTARYDLSNRPAKGVTMLRSKVVQEGVRVKLPSSMTWETLFSVGCLRGESATKLTS
jgi:hypothetical protein